MKHASVTFTCTICMLLLTSLLITSMNSQNNVGSARSTIISKYERNTVLLPEDNSSYLTPNYSPRIWDQEQDITLQSEDFIAKSETDTRAYNTAIIAASSSYTNHDPIEINGNGDFFIQGWPGNGTEANPFRISGLNIDTYSECISISNVDAFFVINNNLLYFDLEWNAGDAYRPWGIGLHNTSNGIIESNRIGNKAYGIFLKDSENCSINGNIFERTIQGLYVEGSAFCSVSNNTFDRYNARYSSGVHIFLSEDFNFSSNIYRNLISYLGSERDAIYLRNSTRLNFADIHLFSIRVGISSYNSSHILIENCTFTEIGNVGQFIQCSNIELRNCTFQSFWRGISFYNSFNCIISNCTIYSYYEGIVFSSSFNCIISNCTIYSYYEGIVFSSSFNCLISNCIIYSYYEGIVFSSSFNCLISNCTITSDRRPPIRFWDSFDCAVENTILNGQRIEIGFYEMNNFNFRIENVTLDGKLVGYFEDIASIEVDCFQYSQIILASCSGVELNGDGHSNITGGILIWSSDNINVHDLNLGQMTINFANDSRVSNVTLNDGEGGISVSSCINLDFDNITILKTWGWGTIEIWDSQRITITDSQIQTVDGGIYIYSSEDCVFSDLQIESYGTSISISDSYSCILRNSIFTSIWEEAIHLQSSQYIQIEDCNLGNGGIGIYGEYVQHWSHIMNNITLDDKPLGFFRDTANLAIDGNSYSQLIFVSCQNITLQNVELTQAAHGFQFVFSSNCRISDVVVSYNSGYGEHLISCDSFIIEHLTYNGNMGPFRIMQSNNIIVRDSFFSQQGIEIREGSWNCSVTDNTFNNAGSGIVIYESDYCIVSDNRLEGGWQGISLYSVEEIAITNNSIVSGYGITLSSSSRCLVSQNTINSDYVGIDIAYGDSNKITGNRIHDWYYYGIFIYDETNLIFTYNEIIGTGGVVELQEGSFNLFYGNLFYNNAENYPNQLPVIDNGHDNQWDNGEGIGNCWGLYRGEGPYEIEGTAGSEDRYPIFLDSTDIISPIISSPPDIILQGDENKPIIPWIVWGPPGSMALYQNGYLIDSGLWNGSGPFFYELINIGFGNHTFTLEIYDPDGIMDSDSVIVQGLISLTSIVQISAAGAGTIIVIGLVFLEIRKRRRISPLVKGDISSEAISASNPF